MIDAISLPDEERMESVLAVSFRGIHHCPGIKKTPDFWSVCVTPMATYDFDVLTRIVLAAHHFGVRVDVRPGGPRTVKVVLHPRKNREGGSMCERHPTIQQAIAALNLEGGPK